MLTKPTEEKKRSAFCFRYYIKVFGFEQILINCAESSASILGLFWQRSISTSPRLDSYIYIPLAISKYSVAISSALHLRFLLLPRYCAQGRYNAHWRTSERKPGRQAKKEEQKGTEKPNNSGHQLHL